MIRRGSGADRRTYEERLAAAFEEPEQDDDMPVLLTARLAFLIAIVMVFVAGATLYFSWLVIFRLLPGSGR